jgi:3-oxoacyl-[acyl-carrier-protein] synthase-3
LPDRTFLAQPARLDGATAPAHRGNGAAPAPRPAARSQAPLARGARVGAVGVAVPAAVVTNAPIAERLGVSERWIVTRTGVRERRIAAADERLPELAAAAGRRALAGAGLEPAELDLVLVATMSHDHLTPHAAPLVAAALGAGRAGALDLNSACSGFVSALAMATGQVDSGRAENALVIGVDLMSRLTDAEDRSTAALFGDGAGAVVVRAGDGPGRIGPFVLGADGSRADLVKASRAEALLRMNGHDTFRQAVDRLADATTAAAAGADIRLDAIDLFVYHQANRRILAAVGERLGLDPARVIDCIDRYGNTSAATVPLALATAEQEGRLTEGSRCLLAAFGGGLSWAATVVEWGLADA